MACGDNFRNSESNHCCVPDFEMDEDYSIPSSGLTKQSGEDEIMELLWQNNAPVAVHPPNPRSLPKPPSSYKPVGVAQPPPPSTEPNNQLYMADDEMAAWLHYPLEEFYSELIYPNSSTATPPPPPAERPPDNRVLPSQLVNRRPVTPAPRGFPLFSRMAGSGAVEPPARLRSGLTVADSSDTPIPSSSNRREGPNVAAPAVAPAYPSGSVVVTSTAPAAIPGVGESLVKGDGASEGGMASPESSSATNSATATATATATGEVRGRKERGEVVDRKRKSVEIDESAVAATATTVILDTQNEDVELESGDEKKQSRGSSATKRTRAAEVHNLSERRRRDRINEKMKALQELIPRCNKSDKASMLDEAIEYLKSLQMQVQMMSMGCGMVPMMYPGMQQQYMPAMGMGMGMGMGMDMGMTRPVMPYAPVIPAPAVPAPGASIMPPLAPRLPVPPFAMPSVPAPHLSVNQPRNAADTSNNPYAFQNSGMAQIPNMADPYQQYLAYQQIQMQMQMQAAAQNQASSQPGSSKPTPSKSEGDNEDDIR